MCWCVYAWVCLLDVVCFPFRDLLYQVTVPEAVLLSQETWHKTRQWHFTRHKLGIIFVRAREYMAFGEILVLWYDTTKNSLSNFVGGTCDRTG